MLNADGLVLSTAEVALIAELGGAAPLFRWDAPGLQGAGWEAVLDGLRARAIVVRDDEADRLSPELRPLLGVALLADRGLAVEVSSVESSLELTYLTTQGVAVEVQRYDETLIRLAPIPPESILSRVLVALDLPESPAAAAQPVEPEVATVEEYLGALGGSGPADPARPGLDALAGAISAGRPVRSLDVLRAGEQSDRLTIFEGEHGLLVAERHAGSGDVAIQRVRDVAPVIARLIEPMVDASAVPIT